VTIYEQQEFIFYKKVFAEYHKITHISGIQGKQLTLEEKIKIMRDLNRKPSQPEDQNTRFTTEE